MFNIFKKKNKTLEGLERAKELELITELEFLKLKSDRAERELKEHLAKETKKKK